MTLDDAVKGTHSEVDVLGDGWDPRRMAVYSC